MKTLTPQTFLSEFKEIKKKATVIEVLTAIDELLKSKNAGFELVTYDGGSTSIFVKAERDKTAAPPPPPPGQGYHAPVHKLPKSVDETRQKRLGGAYIKPVT